MTALHPLLALGAVAAIAVPLLIHLLLRRRRAPVAWGAMQFLMQAYQKQRRRVQLEQLLLLACRCGLVLFFGLGIARLLLGGGSLTDAHRPTALTIVIDDSLTAAVQHRTQSGALQSALDIHVANAQEALDRLDPTRGDRAALITLAAPAQARLWPHTPDLDSVRRVLRDLEPSESAADLNGASVLLGIAATGTDGAEVNPQSTAGFSESARVRTLLLSEFRSGSISKATSPVSQDGSEPAASSTAIGWPGLIAAEPATDTIGNTWIASLTPERGVVLVDPLDSDASTVPVSLTVALGRVTDQASLPAPSTTVRFRARRIEIATGADTNAIPVGLGEVQVAWDANAESARSTTTVELPKPRTGQRAVYEIEAVLSSDALGSDNTLATGLMVRTGLRVGLVVPSTSVGTGSVAEFTAREWVELALDPGGELDPRTNIRARTIDPARLTDAALSGLDAVIVLRPDLLNDTGWSALGRTVGDGRTVMIFPPSNPATPTWPDQFDEAFGVVAPLTREANEHEPALAVQAAADISSAPTLGPLVAELDELLRGVTVSRSIASASAGPSSAGPSGPTGSSSSNMRSVLSLGDGRPALIEMNVDAARAATDAANSGEPGIGTRRGRLLLWTISPDLAWTNLPARAVFVPIMQELVRSAIASSIETVVAGQRFTTPSVSASVTRVDDDRTTSISPDALQTEQRAGRLRILDGAGRRVNDILVQHDPAASPTSVLDRAGVAAALLGNDLADAERTIAWLDPTNGTIENASEEAAITSGSRDGQELSLWLLAIAAALAVAEPVLSRIITARAALQGPRREPRGEAPARAHVQEART
jgi:hypothetical protein